MSNFPLSLVDSGSCKVKSRYSSLFFTRYNKVLSLPVQCPSSPVHIWTSIYWQTQFDFWSRSFFFSHWFCDLWWWRIVAIFGANGGAIWWRGPLYSRFLVVSSSGINSLEINDNLVNFLDFRKETFGCVLWCFGTQWFLFDISISLVSFQIHKINNLIKRQIRRNHRQINHFRKI